MKIKLLQLLLQDKFVEKEKLLAEYEKISKSPATSDVLKYLGISKALEIKSKPTSKDSTPKDGSRSSDSPKCSSDLKLKGIKTDNINPAVSETENQDKTPCEIKPTLVLSSRVKPIEELSVPETLVNKVQERKKEDVANANYIYNDLLSPYSDQSLSMSKQKNSPSKSSQNGSSTYGSVNKKRDYSCRRNHHKTIEKETNASNTKGNGNEEKIANVNSVTFKRDITEYFLTNKSNGEIDFPKLLRDEIADVDQILIQESKKAMQIGGNIIPKQILISHTMI